MRGGRRLSGRGCGVGVSKARRNGSRISPGSWKVICAGDGKVFAERRVTPLTLEDEGERANLQNEMVTQRRRGGKCHRG